MITIVIIVLVLVILFFFKGGFISKIKCKFKENSLR